MHDVESSTTAVEVVALNYTVYMTTFTLLRTACSYRGEVVFDLPYCISSELQLYRIVSLYYNKHYSFYSTTTLRPAELPQDQRYIVRRVYTRCS